MRLLGVLLALLLATPAAANQDTPLPDTAQEAQARAVMREVRCLVCEGQSIADSGAEMAVDLRALVRTRIARGDSPLTIKDDLRSRYGDNILLRPPVTAQTGLLWAMPVLLLLLGAFLARTLFFRQPRVFPVQAESSPSPSGEGLGRGILDTSGQTGPTPVPSPEEEGSARLDMTRKNSK